MSDTSTDALTIPLWGYKTALDYQNAIHAHCVHRNMEIEDFFKKAFEDQMKPKEKREKGPVRAYVPITNKPSPDVSDRLARNARRYSMIARSILADLRDHKGTVVDSRTQYAKRFAVNAKQLQGILHALLKAKCIDATEEQRHFMLRLLPAQDVDFLKLFEQLS